MLGRMRASIYDEAKSNVKLARQLYNIAKHVEEGWLTDKERRIIETLGEPDIYEARISYRVALAKSESHRKKGQGYQKKWEKYYTEFSDKCIDGRSRGMSEEEEAALCQSAREVGMPWKVIGRAVHHEVKWIKAHVDCA